MTATLTAVYERHDDCFIGYVEELTVFHQQNFPFPINSHF